jgi:hypothetical protein
MHLIPVRVWVALILGLIVLQVGALVWHWL